MLKSNGSFYSNWSQLFDYDSDTVLKTTLLIPSYLIFTIINGYMLGYSNNVSRHIKHTSISLLRFITFLLLCSTLVTIFFKYFLDIDGYHDNSDDLAKFSTSLISDIYQVISISLHILVLFNKSVFFSYPLTLLVSFIFMTITNLLYFFNLLFINWTVLKNFDLDTYQKFNFTSIFIFNFLLFSYFLILVLYFSTELYIKSLTLNVEELPYLEFNNEDENQPPCEVAEEDRANYLSYITFSWLRPIMVKGFKQEIKTLDQLSRLPSELSLNKLSDTLMSQFSPKESDKKVYNEHKNNPILNPDLLLNQEYMENTAKENEDVDFLNTSNSTNTSNKSLISALLGCFGKEFFILGVFKLINDTVNFSGPLLLNQLVHFVETKETTLKEGCMYATALFVFTLIGSMVNIHFSNSMNKLCLKIKTVLITLIYRKAIVARLDQLNKFSTGSIVNHMSIDTDAVVNAFPCFHSFWSLPFQVSITLYMLHSQIGISFLVAVSFVVILIPINKLIGDLISKVQQNLMIQKDCRVKLMTEFLNGIRVIKFYSWEKFFLNRINLVREKELRQLKAKRYLDAGFVYFWACTPILMSVLTFMAYVLFGNRLIPTKVFTSLSLFNMLISPLNSFPNVINGLIKANVSYKRLQEFLSLKNLNWLTYYSYNEDLYKEDNLLMNVQDGEFKWKKERPNEHGDETDRMLPENFEHTSALTGINLEVKKGQLIGVIGKVGSGKTSLLHAIMAEISRAHGKVGMNLQNCSNGFAYVGQDCWIMAGSFKENILFGKEMDQEKYQQVIEACALAPDLAALPDGDETFVGDNGVSLSGGQKTRLALSRACYATEKEIYIFDGPFTSIDPSVAKQIYEACICDLLANKTRILCTHHAEYLMNADLVLVIENGTIVKSGPGAQIIPSFAQLKRAYKCSSQSLCNLKSFKHDPSINFNDIIKLEEQIKLINQRKRIKMQADADGEHGVIDFKVYKYYCFSIGICLSILTLIILTLVQISRNLTDFWLSYWTEHHSFLNVTIHSVEVFYYKNLIMSEINETNFFLNVYGGLCALNSFFTLFKTFFFAYNGIVAGRFIHRCLIDNLSRANLKFFHTTPTGKILNRLSSDIYAINGSLPITLNIFLAKVFSLIGVFVVTCYSLPLFSLSLFPLSIVYYKIQSYYRWTSRELKRITSISLTPVYSHFHETLGGITTIRAFRQVDRFIKQNEIHLNNYNRAAYVSMAATQWLNFRLQMISVLMITAVGFTAVFQHIYGSANASLVGLALSYILSVTTLLNGLITSFTETEKEMVAVERAHQFEKIESENWVGIESIPTNWPLNPFIEFKDVCLRYNTEDDEDALKSVSFLIKAGEKVGICGRTGSGKSSLFMALFRGEELKSGTIRIDNVNIRNLSLNNLRESMGIIPQDPFLFDGTLRENLDLSNFNDDTILWNALKKCRLDEKFKGEPAGLDFRIEERGKNLSSGEKQLVCLARAIITNRKILCIDEATASVDFDTDNFIQQTIRREFKHATILKIAHRMNTIINYDKILVIDDGNVVEFDTPKNLLANSNSVFYSLVNLDMQLEEGGSK